MASPDRAPRRTATQTSLNSATGQPVPGVNAGVYTRKAASSDGMAEGKTYMNQRNAGKVGLTPENVQVNK